MYDLLEPERFELVEIEHEVVETMLVNKSIMKRMPVEAIIEVLGQEVFPYISTGEIVKVDFKVKISVDNIESSVGLKE